VVKQWREELLHNTISACLTITSHGFSDRLTLQPGFVVPAKGENYD
jgi:HD superfamily phosphohydrolase YqeK